MGSVDDGVFSSISHQAAVTSLLILNFLITVQTSSIEACPKGLFLLDRAPTSSSPYSTSGSSRTCVEVCPLGFYPSIKLMNKPTFSDLRAGNATRGALLRCLPCPSSCTTCLGLKPQSCFVCDDQWIQKHKSGFEHENKATLRATMQTVSSDCAHLEKIINRKQKRVFPVKSRSIGTAVLLVILSGMFSAILVFSLYRLHWERRRATGSSSSGCASMLDWISRFCERKKYSAITTEDRSERATWSCADEEEATIFATNTVKFRDGNIPLSARESRVAEDLSSDFDN